MRTLHRMIYAFFISMVLLPAEVFAHEGTEEKTNTLLSASLYVLGGMMALFLVLLVLYRSRTKQVRALQNVKSKEERIRRQELAKTLPYFKWGWIASLLGAAAAAAVALIAGPFAGGNVVKLEHVHGLAYSTDGERILVPAHDGIKIYGNGHWDDAEGEKHDYMGFSAVDDGFYSSGHPAPGSDKKNPFGVIKSTDEGKILETLDLYGDIDFHYMAVGYRSHAIYVMNPQENERMSTTGLYYSTDATKTWTKSAMKGMGGEPTSIAVHPSDEAIVAIGTPSGVYVSNDYGQTFTSVLAKGQATSLYFNAEGVLFIGGYNDKAYLLKMDIESKASEEVTLPDFEEDAVAYFAQNPVRADEMAFATFKKDVYVSKDGGAHWQKIADEGTGLTDGAE